MTTQLPESFVYEQCDVPEGVSLTEWRAQSAPPRRRAQVAGGLVAAVATLAPMLLSVRGSRRR